MRTFSQIVKERCVVDPVTDCWSWTGASTNGRPYVKVSGKLFIVYRALFEELKKVKLDRRILVCHRCDNGLCCNPEHLFAGTQAANMKDMASKGRHFSKTKPEIFKAATAKSRKILEENPQLRKRGDDHWTRRHPEKVKRGKDHWTAKRR